MAKSPPTNQTFAHQTRFLTIGLISAACFILIGGISAALPWFDGDTSRQTALYFSLFLIACWSFMLLMSAHIVATYYRHTLHLSEDSISQQGVFRRRVIATNTAEVIWRGDTTCERIEVVNKDTKIRIDLFIYTNDEQEQIIAFFRNRFSQQVQQGWQAFEAKRSPPIETPQTSSGAGFLYFVVGALLFYWFLLG